tara:strand:+ start:1310 stop:1732 length:423 start_codon:yes stop_codon:yes gene_type:complete
MTQPIVVGSELKFVKEADVRVVCLSADVPTGSAYMSLLEDNVAYVIPAGKALWITSVFINDRSGSGATPIYELHYGAQDVAGTVFADFGCAQGTSASVDGTTAVTFPLHKGPIAAGNYITLGNTYSSKPYIIVNCVECDL